MDYRNRTRTRARLRFGREQTRNRTGDRYKRLSPEQQLAETIFSVGILPAFCILGLVACILFLRTTWQKRGKGTTNHLPLVIAIFDAIYLLLTLQERIEYSLANIFDVFGGFNVDVKSSLTRVAKFSLSMGTAILCLHSVEVCHAVLYPMTYRTIWTRKRRFLIATAVIAFGLLFFVSFQIMNLTMDDRQRLTIQEIRILLQDGLFNVLLITTMTACYIIVIVKRFQQILFKSTAKSSNKKDQTNKLIRSLILASSVYFVLGVPVDFVKCMLTYIQNIDKTGVAYWAIRLVQNILEVLYGSALLFVYILNEVTAEKRSKCCACLKRKTMEDESGVRSGLSNPTGSTSADIEERA